LQALPQQLWVVEHLRHLGVTVHELQPHKSNNHQMRYVSASILLDCVKRDTMYSLLKPELLHAHVNPDRAA
jgi:hypothetical protein